MVRTYLVNYRRRDKDDGRAANPVHVAAFVREVPRVAVWCRLFGHRSVVDGTKTITPGHRWVVCDRCGERPEPQGSLDPTVWNIGDRYTGEFATAMGVDGNARKAALAALNSDVAADRGRAAEVLRTRPVYDGRGAYLPGRYPRQLRGELGFEFVVRRSNQWSGVGWEAKVGNGGSEHTLALNLYIPFVSLYLHTGGFGAWMVRRFNPTDLESKMVGLRLVGGRLEWQLWAPRDNLKGRQIVRWRKGELSMRWRDKLLGPRRYTYTDVPGGEVTRVLRLPEGDYLLGLKLQTVTFGRRRGRRRQLPPMVEWSALGPGVPTKGPLRGRTYGSAVEVPELAMRAGTWPAEAIAAITVQVTQTRTGYGWEPTGKVPVEAGSA